MGIIKSYITTLQVAKEPSEHNSPNGMRNQKVPKNNWKKLDIDVDYNHRPVRRNKNRKSQSNIFLNDNNNDCVSCGSCS